MKTKLLAFTAVVALLISNPGRCQTTMWTYQGRLNNGASPANGLFDFQFAVFNASSGGIQQGVTLTNAALSVSNGLFTALLDFGSGVFTGPDRWLDIGVRSNGAPVAFATLTSRQRLTPSPYAIFAPNAGTAATANGLAASTVSSSQLNTPGAPGTGQVLAYNGATLIWTNPATAAAGWTLSGNSGTSAGLNFLGTTDNQALELKANSSRMMRFEPNANNAPNVIGGAANNYVQPGIVGATIGGGGATNYNTGVLGLGLSSSNAIRSDFGVIGGGLANLVQSNANYSVVAGGFNLLLGTNSGSAFMGAGYQNAIQGNSTSAVLVGGDQNFIEPGSPFSTLGGGGVNGIRSNGYSAAIVGGEGNQIGVSGRHAFIGGGQGNNVLANAGAATISGGSNNVAGGFAATVGGGAKNSATGTYSTIGGGSLNTNTGSWSTIGGGTGNRLTATLFGTIAGGDYNQVLNDYGTVGGGVLNTNMGNVGTISGGQQNYITGGAATIPGGSLNTAGGDFSFAAGYRAKALHVGSFVWADSAGGIGSDFSSTTYDQFLVRAGNGVGINTNNTSGASLTVLGGIRNGAGGTVQSRVEVGTVNVGTGTNGVNTFTINFPTAFSTTPKVFAIARGNDNPDTFAISTRAVTATSFKINVVRIDIASGWGQALNVDWYATE